MSLTREKIRKLIIEELLRTEEPTSEMSEFSSSSPGRKVIKEGKRIMTAGKAINAIAYEQTGRMRGTLGKISEFVYKVGEALSSIDDLEEEDSVAGKLPTVSELKQLQKELQRLEKL
jgi:hypothetical protein